MGRAMPRMGFAAAAALLPVGAFLWTVTGVAGAVTSPTGSSGTVAPVMECEFNNGSSNDKYSAIWGYTNTTGGTVTIAIGSSNEFTPGAQNRGQPTSFTPGTNTDAFTTNWNGSSSQSWVLNGTTATAQQVVNGNPAPACSTKPVPIAAPQTLIWIAAGGVTAGIVVVVRRRRRVPRPHVATPA